MYPESERTQSRLVEVNVPDLNSLIILEGQLGITGDVKLLLPADIFLSGELKSHNSGQVILEGTIRAYSNTPRGGVAYYIKSTTDNVLVCLRQAHDAKS